MKVAVLNSQKVSDLDISQYIPSDCDAVIVGGCFGYDERILLYAMESKKDFYLKLPLTDTVGIEKVIEEADCVISFVKNHDECTAQICKKAGKRYTEIKVEIKL